MMMIKHNVFESHYNIIWFNPSRSGDAFMCHTTRASLVQIMACHLFGAKPLSKPVLAYCSLDTWEHELWIKTLQFSYNKMNLKMLFAKCWSFCRYLKVITWYWTQHSTDKSRTLVRTLNLNNAPHSWHPWVSNEMNIFHTLCSMKNGLKSAIMKITVQ